jgi:hypothetical protein
MINISVPANAKSVNKLLKAARQSDIILKAADGEQFVLMKVTDVQTFEVGDSDDFEEEIAATRQNKALMAFLDERRKKAKGKKGVSLEEAERRLGNTV